MDKNKTDQIVGMIAVTGTYLKLPAIGRNAGEPGGGLTCGASPRTNAFDQGYPEPAINFQEGQWWLRELDSMAGTGTPDQKRAVAVVRHLLLSAQVPIGMKLAGYVATGLMSDGQRLPLMRYSGALRGEVEAMILSVAMREGFKGTIKERLDNLGWVIKPLYIAEEPGADPPPVIPIRRFIDLVKQAGMAHNSKAGGSWIIMGTDDQLFTLLESLGR